MERGDERWKGWSGKNKHPKQVSKYKSMNILGHISHRATKTEKCYWKHQEATSNEGWCTGGDPSERQRKEEKREKKKRGTSPKRAMFMKSSAGSCSGVLPAHAVEGLGEYLRGHACSCCRIRHCSKGHWHSSAVLGTFTAGKTYSI